MPNEIYWANLLTRNAMFCQQCYRDAQMAYIAETKAGVAHPAREVWVRIADPAWFAAGITPVNPRTKAAYTTKLRAAFRAHWAAVHAGNPMVIRWSR